MNTTKINPVYAANASKINGNTLDAEEWNALSNAAATSHEKINDIIDDIVNTNNNIATISSNMTTDNSGNTIITSDDDIVLKTPGIRNSIILKTGNLTTVAQFNKSNTQITADEYTFNKNGVWSGYGNLSNEKCTTGEIINATSKMQDIFYPQIKVHRCIASGDIFDDASVDQSDSRLLIIIPDSNVTDNYGNLNIGDTLLAKLVLFDLIDNGSIGYGYFGGGSDLQHNIVWNTDATNKRMIKNQINENILNFFIAFVEDNLFLDNGVVADLEDEPYIYEFVLGDKTYMYVNNIVFTNGLLSIPGEDIITLVKYFKTGDGQQNGPWANS